MVDFHRPSHKCHWKSMYLHIVYDNVVDFTELRAHYHTILCSMPNDFEMTIGMLQNYISNDQICAVLCSSNSTAANMIILDSLVERLRCRKNLLDLCDQLESIMVLHDLSDAINKIRLGQ